MKYVEGSFSKHVTLHGSGGDDTAIFVSEPGETFEEFETRVELFVARQEFKRIDDALTRADSLSDGTSKARAPLTNSRITRAPGHSVLAVLHFLFPRKVFDSVFAQIVGDMREE